MRITDKNIRVSPSGPVGYRFVVDTTDDPAGTDDSANGFVVGSRWINTATGIEFVLVDPSVGAAQWSTTTNAAPTGIEAGILANTMPFTIATPVMAGDVIVPFTGLASGVGNWGSTGTDLVYGAGASNAYGNFAATLSASLLAGGPNVMRLRFHLNMLPVPGFESFTDVVIAPGKQNVTVLWQFFVFPGDVFHLAVANMTAGGTTFTDVRAQFAVTSQAI